jgi:DNA helicase-2/ATP-dependent DNA helicase PcrA
MPQKPYKQTRTGTLFHGWVEQHFSMATTLELQTSEDNADETYEDQVFEVLKRNFESSRWAGVMPVEIEREIQLTVGSNTFICKLDAVFKTETGVEIIDWKTGRAPTDDLDLVERTLQLALYRVAYSRFSGIPVEDISVGFYFVADNLEVTPKAVPSEREVLDLWAAALANQEA